MSHAVHTAIHPAVRRQTIADALRRTAIRLPAKTGIVCGATTWTYAEFDALVSRLAAGLASIGVAEGDKVAVLARNSHGFAALRFALARRGAVMVPINFMLKADEVAYILRHAGAKTLATDSGLAELAQAASKLDTKVEQFIWLPSEDPSQPVAGMHSFDTLAACTDALPDVQLGSHDVAQIVYTSGTESSPKGAQLTHDAVMWQYVSCVIDAEIAEQDVALHALPLYHCAQLDVFFGPAIYMGSTNVITSKPTPDNLLPMIEKFGITSFFAPPTVWITRTRFAKNGWLVCPRLEFRVARVSPSSLCRTCSPTLLKPVSVMSPRCAPPPKTWCLACPRNCESTPTANRTSAPWAAAKTSAPGTLAARVWCSPAGTFAVLARPFHTCKTTEPRTLCGAPKYVATSGSTCPPNPAGSRNPQHAEPSQSRQSCPRLEGHKPSCCPSRRRP